MQQGPRGISDSTHLTDKDDFLKKGECRLWFWLFGCQSILKFIGLTSDQWLVYCIMKSSLHTTHNYKFLFKVLIYVLFYLPCTVKPVMGDHLLRRKRSHKTSALSKRTLERHTLSPVIKGYLLPGYNHQNDGLQWQEISHKAGHSKQVLPYPVLCLGTSKLYKIKMFDSYVEKNKLHNNQRPLCMQPPVPYPSSKTISGSWAPRTFAW